MHSVRFYGPLKYIGIRTSIASDAIVDGIVVRLTVHRQQYRENIKKSTTDAYKRMYTHK